MRGTFTALARGLGWWCWRRVMRPSNTQDLHPVCKLVKISAVKDRWHTVVVPDVGAVLIPAKKTPRTGRKIVRGRVGLGGRTLMQTQLPVGPVHPSDFGLSYALVQDEHGVKRLYQTADDLAPFLHMPAHE